MTRFFTSSLLDAEKAEQDQQSTHQENPASQPLTAENVRQHEEKTWRHSQPSVQSEKKSARLLTQANSPSLCPPPAKKPVAIESVSGSSDTAIKPPKSKL